MFLVSAYRIVAYYVTLVLFGLGGLVVNGVALAACWVPRTRRSERFFQRFIHRAFRLFIGWMACLRICRVRCDGALERLPCGVVIVANHPGLMDITYILARMPEAVCLFKPAIRRNPILGAAAVRAGYVVSSEGIDAVRVASDRVAAGHTLVIFPEGTRTPPGRVLGPLRPGFALIARRANAAIQLLHIRCNSNVLAKGCAWWKPPRMPVEVSLELGPWLEPAPEETTTALADRVAQLLAAAGGDAGEAGTEPGFAAAPQGMRTCG